MEEWTEKQLSDWLEQGNGSMYVFLYTPLCGTCKVTERMLQVVMAMQPELPVVKANVNFCPKLAQGWRIESVPSLVHLAEHRLLRKKYRMQGVDELVRWFQDKENMNI